MSRKAKWILREYESLLYIYGRIGVIPYKAILKQRCKRVGLLATPSTYQFGLYAKLNTNVVSIIEPSLQEKSALEAIIRQTIAGAATDSGQTLLLEIIEEFIKRDRLDGVILGCTELPLLYPRECRLPVISSLNALAEGLLRSVRPES